MENTDHPLITPCPECGNERVQVHGSKYMEVDSQSLAGWSTLKALVCTVCGHTTFYATNPGAFIQPHTQELQEQSTHAQP